MEKATQNKENKQANYQPEQHVQDVNNREIFKNNLLVSQFLKNYTDIPIFENISEKDVEDVTEKYQAFLGVVFEADTVKKISVRDKKGVLQREVYVISLIEHKSRVDYDVAMQLLRYMSVIWYEYGCGQNKLSQGSSDRKNFRYPLIIPIVYYEGKEKWTAGLHLKERIDYVAGTERYIPDFQYEIAGPGKYTNEELSVKKDEMALVMLMNKIQSEEDLEAFRKISEEIVNEIYKKAPDEIQEIYQKVLWGLLMKMKVPNNEAKDIVEHVQGERSMGYLFENMDEIDIQAERKKTQRQRELTEEERKRTEEEKKRAEEEKKRAEEEKKRAEEEKKRAEEEKKRADEEKKRADEEKKRAENAEKIAEKEKERADKMELENQKLRKELERVKKQQEK